MIPAFDNICQIMTKYMHMLICCRNSRIYVIFANDTTFLKIGLWCLTPLSTIVHLHRGDIDGGKRSIRWKPPTCHKSLTNFITWCCIECTPPRTEFEPTTLVVIGNDCTDSCKSNNHTITANDVPLMLRRMDNRETHSTLDTRHWTMTNKTKTHHIILTNDQHKPRQVDVLEKEK